jgi:predicted SnoaL-like aldol condensation-catalyzing enzyme
MWSRAGSGTLKRRMTAEIHPPGGPADGGVNKGLVLEAFDLLFNKRDYAAAEARWSANYIQHSALIAPGRGGLLERVKSLPSLRYENQFAVAEGDLVVLYGRFSGINPEAMVTVNVVRVEDGRLAEHWDVWEKEATRAESVSGLPMFGDSFPDER